MIAIPYRIESLARSCRLILVPAINPTTAPCRRSAGDNTSTTFSLVRKTHKEAPQCDSGAGWAVEAAGKSILQAQTSITQEIAAHCDAQFDRSSPARPHLLSGGMGTPDLKGLPCECFDQWAVRVLLPAPTVAR